MNGISRDPTVMRLQEKKRKKKSNNNDTAKDKNKNNNFGRRYFKSSLRTEQSVNEQ